MRRYETMVVLQPQLDEEEIAAIIGRISDIIDEHGEVEEVLEWGTRTLAYTIDKKYTEGYYILITFKIDDSIVLDELEHYYKITDSIIRSIIVKQDDEEKKKK